MVGSIKAGVMSNPMFIKRPRNVRNPKGVRIPGRFAGGSRVAALFSAAALRRAAPVGLWGAAGGEYIVGNLRCICGLPAQASPAAVARCVADAVVPVACHGRHYAVGSSLRRLRTTGRRPACCSGLVPCRLPLAFTACGAGGAALRCRTALWQLRMKRRKLTASAGCRRICNKRRLL